MEKCPFCHSPLPSPASPLDRHVTCAGCGENVPLELPVHDSSRSADGLRRPIENLVGQVLGGKYQLVEYIKKGGMGVVYRAYEKGVRRDVAIKVLSDEFATTPNMKSEFRERFRRDGIALGNLKHPHIVPLYGYEEEDGGLAYLVMEYVAGQNGNARTLADELKDGALPLERIIALMEQACDALEAAHKISIIHRDVKPANFLMADRDYIKLTDFGIARVDDAIAQPRLTRPTGPGFGTEGYVAPEQIEGGDVDERTDVFALGAMLYALATGAEAPRGLCFGKSDVSYALPSGRGRAYKPLDKICVKALQVAPNKRYQNVATLKADIKAISRPTRGAFDALLFVALLVVAGLAVYRYGGERIQAPMQQIVERFFQSDSPPQVLPTFVELAQAIQVGNAGTVRDYLQKDATLLGAQDSEGNTALHLAANSGRVEIVELLLGQGADVAKTNKAMRTPLHLAAATGMQQIAASLLLAKAPTGLLDVNGKTARDLAHDAGHEAIARLMAREELVAAIQGRDFARLDSMLTQEPTLLAEKLENGLTPLHLAARDHDAQFLEMILKHQPVVDEKGTNGNTPLHEAAEAGQAANAKILLEKGARPDSINLAGRTPLHLAALAGTNELCEVLAARYDSVDPVDDQGRSPLHWAMEAGNLPAVEVLHAKGANAALEDRDGKSPLTLAKEKGHQNVVDVFESEEKVAQAFLKVVSEEKTDEVRRLLEADPSLANASLPSNKMTALHIASSKANDEILKLLLPHKPEIDARRHPDGDTALHLAVLEQSPTCVELLLKYGASRDIENAESKTPLQLAAALPVRNPKIEKLLGFKEPPPPPGGGTSGRPGAGEEPPPPPPPPPEPDDSNLHQAAKSGDLATLRTFKRGDALIESRNSDGYTPLHVAVANNQIEAIKVLKSELGANVNAKTSGGKSTMSLAKSEAAKLALF